MEAKDQKWKAAEDGTTLEWLPEGRFAPSRTLIDGRHHANAERALRWPNLRVESLLVQVTLLIDGLHHANAERALKLPNLRVESPPGRVTLHLCTKPHGGIMALWARILGLQDLS